MIEETDIKDKIVTGRRSCSGRYGVPYISMMILPGICRYPRKRSPSALCRQGRSRGSGYVTPPITRKELPCSVKISGRGRDNPGGRAGTFPLWMVRKSMEEVKSDRMLFGLQEFHLEKPGLVGWTSRTNYLRIRLIPKPGCEDWAEAIFRPGQPRSSALRHCGGSAADMAF